MWLFSGWLCSAFAAEVVWYSPPDAETRQRVQAAAGAEGDALSVLDLRAAASRATAADAKAIERLEQTLRDVRQYETRLDGELLIMSDLSPSIAEVTLLTGQADLDIIYGALTYQGFAVNRFFADTLGDDERAAPYRVELEDRTVEAPWAAAAALAPRRDLTAYEVAEAPQRVAYQDVRDFVTNMLPASVSVDGLPQGAELWIDGRRADTDAAGTYKLVPGRHLAHVLLDGVVLQRFEGTVAAAERVTWTVSLDDATFNAWWQSFGTDTPSKPPAALRPHLEALKEVVVARPSPDGPRAWTVSADAVTPLELPAPVTIDTAPDPAKPAPTGSLFAAAHLGGGWLSSGDFYNQDPAVVPNAPASVNSGTAALGIEVGWRSGKLWRFAAGLDGMFTLGEYATAYTGESDTRLRTYLHVSAGLEWVQLTGGFLFPYHPAVGGRITLPLVAGLELRAQYTLGIPLTWTREDGSEWTSLPVYSAWGGVGWRL